MKVILCGYNWAGCSALNDLIHDNHEVFVFTHENPPHINSVIELCKKNNIKFSIERISLSNLPFIPDMICSIYYRYIIAEDIINCVNGKIFNLHPSLLPSYKGCSSITWAMIQGETKVGFSYHYIDTTLDTGSIILQKSINVEEWDTQITLYHKVMFEASKDFKEVFQFVKENKTGLAQKKAGTYYKRGCPYQGKINPEWDEKKIERFIRAMIYPPLPYAKYKGVTVTSFDAYKQLKKKGKD